MREAETKELARNELVDSLLMGAVDLHVHSGPSTSPRSVNHIDMFQDAKAAGMRAFLTKDHDYSGAPVAKLLNDHFGDGSTTMFSGVVISNEIGGFNPYAVQHTSQMGGRLVWLPTLNAQNHFNYLAGKENIWIKPEGDILEPYVIPVLEDSGAVRDDVKAVLDVIARHDMILASGHVHISETWKIFEEAQRRGVKRLIVTHPEEVVEASLQDVRGLAAMGAYIEHSLALFIDGSKYKMFDREVLRQHVEAASPESTIMSSDLGQANNIKPVDGLREAIGLCLDLGYAVEDIRKMFAKNAANLLGLDPYE